MGLGFRIFGALGFLLGLGCRVGVLGFRVQERAFTFFVFFCFGGGAGGGGGGVCVLAGSLRG